MEFDREKYSMRIGKRRMSEGIELQNQEKNQSQENVETLEKIGSGHNQRSGDERRN